jgi:hypothetical protein
MECLTRTAPDFDDGARCGQRNQATAIQQPQQPLPIDTGEGPLAVASKQIERCPAKLNGASRPAFSEKPAAIVDELSPALQRHVAGRLCGIEPC